MIIGKNRTQNSILDIVNEQEKTKYYSTHKNLKSVGATYNGYFVSIFKKMVFKLRLQSSKFCVRQSLGGVVGYHASLTH